jgi:hypothetical protein
MGGGFGRKVPRILLASALGGGSGQLHGPTALTLGQEGICFPVGMRGIKSLPLPEIKTPSMLTVPGFTWAGGGQHCEASEAEMQCVRLPGKFLSSSCHLMSTPSLPQLAASGRDMATKLLCLVQTRSCSLAGTACSGVW